MTQDTLEGLYHQWPRDASSVLPEDLEAAREVWTLRLLPPQPQLRREDVKTWMDKHSCLSAGRFLSFNQHML